jgi:prefoldin subunit 5
MSIRPLEGDIAVAADATLARMNRKINELVGASNDDFKAVRKLENKMVDIEKELREIKIRLMNQG